MFAESMIKAARADARDLWYARRREFWERCLIASGLTATIADRALTAWDERFAPQWLKDELAEAQKIPPPPTRPPQSIDPGLEPL